MGIGYSQILTKSISHVSAVPVAGLGSRVLLDGDEYIYAYNGATSLSAPVGYALVARAVTDYTGVISADTDVSPFIGVVKHVAIPAGEYGWVLRRGFGPCGAGNNTGLAAGEHLVIVGTSNTGNLGPRKAQTAYSQVVAPPTYGVVQVATGTGGVGEAYYF